MESYGYARSGSTALALPAMPGIGSIYRPILGMADLVRDLAAHAVTGDWQRMFLSHPAGTTIVFWTITTRALSGMSTQ